MTRTNAWLKRCTLPLPHAPAPLMGMSGSWFSNGLRRRRIEPRVSASGNPLWLRRGFPQVRTGFLVALLLAAQSLMPQSISERQMESAKQMTEAANRQRAAAQIQTTLNETDSFFTAGWSGPAMLPPPLPICPPMAESETDPLIRAAAARSFLNPVLIKAVIRQESGFKPCAISEKGAIGLMQIMPETAQALGTKDPFDPAQNIDAGTRYLKQMLTRFKGDVRLALAAYNAGPEKVDGPKPAVPDIAETRDYVQSITAALHDEPAEVPANSTPDPQKNR